MGLAERRAAKEFQDKHFPNLQAEIHKIAGFPIPIEVNWDQLAEEGQAHLYKDSWPDLYFKPVIEAFRQIGRDDMGKEALKGGVKKVEIRNSKGASSSHNAISFTEGTLQIDHRLANVGDTSDRTKYIIEIVEKAL
jgi:hypothetical protein